MAIQFHAIEVVVLSVPKAPRPIQDYLQEIDCLVGAIADPERTEKIASDQYQLKMRPIGFLELYKFQPIVTLKIWCDDQCQVHIQSLGYELRGLESLMKGFHLEVNGLLRPVQEKEGLFLRGQADLQVQLVLPPPLRFTPKILLKKTGDRLLREILQRIKGKLLVQLIDDYQAWARKTSSPQQELGDRLHSSL